MKKQSILSPYSHHASQPLPLSRIYIYYFNPQKWQQCSRTVQVAPPGKWLYQEKVGGVAVVAVVLSQLCCRAATPPRNYQQTAPDCEGQGRFMGGLD
jgi:hypothetical protein